MRKLGWSMLGGEVGEPSLALHGQSASKDRRYQSGNWILEKGCYWEDNSPLLVTDLAGSLLREMLPV